MKRPTPSLGKGMARLRRDRRGASAIEYALVAALIAIAGIVAFQNLGSQIGDSLDETRDAIATR